MLRRLAAGQGRDKQQDDKLMKLDNGGEGDTSRIKKNRWLLAPSKNKFLQCQAKTRKTETVGSQATDNSLLMPALFTGESISSKGNKNCLGQEDKLRADGM